jgi:para-nitrobenzyl esterase
MDATRDRAPARIASVACLVAAAIGQGACRVDEAPSAKRSLADPVRTGSGLVSGAAVDGGVHVYKGIPFAAAPVGELRWRPPRQLTSWDGVRRCVEYAAACPQPDSSATLGRLGAKPTRVFSEDCLYLNIWTSAKTAGAKLPVMVWFHGGSFTIGTASDDMYNGESLARRGVVVVTTNYRVGPLGFMAHPLLSEESGQDVSGNYGLLDQIAALRWIQENIDGFGGDPDRVTIFGESAGGRSVAHLMVTPLSEGLFHGGIMQSSSLYRPIHHLRDPWYGRPGMETVGERVAQRLGCDQADDPLRALRDKSPEEILEAADIALTTAQPGNLFEPIVDGRVIPDVPSILFETGRQHAVPMIGGSNADEGTLFMQRMSFDDLEVARRLVRLAYPLHSDEILELHPFTTAEEARDAIDEISSVTGCGAPMRSIVRSMAKVGSNAYLYYFTRIRGGELGQQLGAFHGSDIRFVFDNLEGGRTPIDDVDRRLADAMSSYWVRFAATGDPNGPGLPRWLPYDATDEPYLELGDQVLAKHHLLTASCDLFEKILAERRANRSRPED